MEQGSAVVSVGVVVVIGSTATVLEKEVQMS
jgi:hypothetical protein